MEEVGWDGIEWKDRGISGRLIVMFANQFLVFFGVLFFFCRFVLMPLYLFASIYLSVCLSHLDDPAGGFETCMDAGIQHAMGCRAGVG